MAIALGFVQLKKVTKGETQKLENTSCIERVATRFVTNWVDVWNKHFVRAYFNQQRNMVD